MKKVKKMFREAVISQIVAGKRVLDCGGVDHGFGDIKRSQGEWLHAVIAERAASCLGVDILEDRVRAINLQGKYKFVAMNVEELEFSEEFDVVVAGEIVEHVYNAGRFLDSAWRSLVLGGKIVITTPNFHSLSKFVHVAIRGVESCHPEHTCYYSRQTLSYLLETHGFSVDSVHFIGRRSRSRLVGLARAMVCRVRPALSETLLVVATKVASQPKYDNKW